MGGKKCKMIDRHNNKFKFHVSRKSMTGALVTKSKLEKSMIEILPFYAILFLFLMLLLPFECFERFYSLNIFLVFLCA